MQLTLETLLQLQQLWVDSGSRCSMQRGCSAVATEGLDAVAVNEAGVVVA